MLSYSLAIFMWFLTKELCGFPAYTVKIYIH